MDTILVPNNVYCDMYNRGSMIWPLDAQLEIITLNKVNVWFEENKIYVGIYWEYLKKWFKI